MLLTRLRTLAADHADTPALQNQAGTLTYGALHAAVQSTAAALRALQVNCLGLLMDNSPAWVVMDLAALEAGITVVPLPGFFSSAQLRHVIEEAAVDALCTDSGPSRDWPGFAGTGAPLPATRLYLASRPRGAQRYPEGTAKLTFTSGTTGTPKGVCLDRAAMFAVADAVVQATAHCNIERHLCVLPLSLLLENICGVYAPLLAGATVCLPDSAARGLHGSQRLDTGQLLHCLNSYRPDSLVLVPQLLKALTLACEQGLPVPETLRFVAVGGARVSAGLLQAARRAGLPAYEGYGLSEAASVVSLNTPGDERSGSAGRPLAHVRLKIAADGEIHVAGATLLGYSGEPPREDRWYATGDLGYLDEDGFLFLTGRRKNLFVTAYGRNVDPAWPESELLRFPEIAQAVVFGEAREHNIAVIQPADEQLSDARVEQCIREANAALPDYARVHEWLRARQPFSTANGLLTGNGKPRRAAVWSLYRQHIEPAGAATADTRRIG